MAARKPATLLLLNGRGDGLDSAGRPVPAPPNFARQAPAAPRWLSREGRAEWRRVAPALERLDLVKAEDRAMLAAHCETWARFVAAVAQYRAEGITVTNPETGNLRKHPAVGIAEVAAAGLRAFAAEFGLSPAAERRIGAITGPDTDDNPFAG